MHRLAVIALAFLAIVGCNSQTHGFSDSGELAFSRAAAEQGNEFLAYQHTVVVDTSESELPRSFQAVSNACAADRENLCTVLHSELNSGEYDRAEIRMRVKSEGIAALVELAAGSGDVVRRSTYVEDLAKTIADIDKRIAILTATRDRLFELEERGTDDVESLIKITTELTRVQAELEEALGQSAYQRQRIDLDILTIEFVVESGRSFWSPVGESMSSFTQLLSEGLADTIGAIAYLLPWSLLLLAVGYLLRKLWKRSRSSAE